MTRRRFLKVPAVGIIGAGLVGQSLMKLYGKSVVYDPAKGLETKDNGVRSESTGLRPDLRSEAPQVAVAMPAPA